nr:MAG TPA: hypothetical protein [Caudoviricetes sp.]
MILEQAAMMGPVLCTTHIPIRRLKPVRLQHRK